jgi:hypothetical protein
MAEQEAQSSHEEPDIGSAHENSRVRRRSFAQLFNKSFRRLQVFDYVEKEDIVVLSHINIRRAGIKIVDEATVQFNVIHGRYIDPGNSTLFLYSQSLAQVPPRATQIEHARVRLDKL